MTARRLTHLLASPPAAHSGDSDLDRFPPTFEERVAASDFIDGGDVRDLWDACLSVLRARAVVGLVRAERKQATQRRDAS